jgi:2-polyprenyl-6-methoxyphenol hydroxylase-like FAD-dependent oxidoreductase
MAKITIVGGGQSGLQLGIGLVQNGYDVTVVSDRTPEQIRDGRVTSSQCMFATALDHERGLGIDFWRTRARRSGHRSRRAHPSCPGEGDRLGCRLDRVAMSVDQRVSSLAG